MKNVYKIFGIIFIILSILKLSKVPFVCDLSWWMIFLLFVLFSLFVSLFVPIIIVFFIDVIHMFKSKEEKEKIRMQKNMIEEKMNKDKNKKRSQFMNRLIQYEERINR